LAAVDFHCTDIDKQMAEATGVSQDHLRTLMWRCSSSVTDKNAAVFSRAAPKEAEEGEREEWTKLQPTFQRLARAILSAKAV